MATDQETDQQETDHEKCFSLITDITVVLHKHEPSMADMMSVFAALIAKNVAQEIKPEYWDALMHFSISLMKSHHEAEYSQRAIH